MVDEMITVPEYEKQLQQRRTQIEQSETQLAQRRERIEQIKAEIEPLTFTRQELIATTPAQRRARIPEYERRKAEILTRTEEQKKEELQKQKQFEEEAKSELEKQKKLEKEFVSIKKRYEEQVKAQKQLEEVYERRWQRAYEKRRLPEQIKTDIKITKISAEKLPPITSKALIKEEVQKAKVIYDKGFKSIQDKDYFKMYSSLLRKEGEPKTTFYPTEGKQMVTTISKIPRTIIKRGDIKLQYPSGKEILVGHEVSKKKLREKLPQKPIFDVSTFGGRIGEVVIEKDPLLGPLARAIKTYEEKKAREGRGVTLIKKREQEKIEAKATAFEERYQKEKLQDESRSEFAKRTKPKWYAGGSFTQKYYELFGVEFYALGERKALIEEEIEKQNPIYTEKYQEAFDKKYLKDIQEGKISYKQAINEFTISKQAREIITDYENKVKATAPTSAWKNTLIGLTDFYAKLAFFKSLMKTAAAKKAEQEVVQEKKLTQRQKLKLYKKAIEEARIKVPSSKIRTEYARVLKSGDPNRITRAEEVIKDYFAQTKEGQKAATDLIRDVKVQEGYIIESKLGESIFTGLKPEGKIVSFGELGKIKDVGITEGRIPSGTLAPPKTKLIFDIAEAPQLERLAEVGLVAGIFDMGKKKDKEKLKDLIIIKPELEKEKEKQILFPALVPILAEVPALAQPQIQVPALAQPQIQVPALAQPQIQVPALAQPPQLEVPALAQPQIPRQPRQLQKPTPKIPKVPIIPLKLGLGKALEKVKEMKPEKFTVFITKEGKDIKTKTLKTKEEAVSFLKKRLLGTIAAGGFIQKNGQKLRFEELGVGTFGKFRRSKVSPFKLIQRKEKRLGGFGEVQEIQFFRKTKKGKKKGRKSKLPFGL